MNNKQVEVMLAKIKAKYPKVADIMLDAWLLYNCIEDGIINEYKYEKLCKDIDVTAGAFESSNLFDSFYHLCNGRLTPIELSELSGVELEDAGHVQYLWKADDTAKVVNFMFDVMKLFD